MYHDKKIHIKIKKENTKTKQPRKPHPEDSDVMPSTKLLCHPRHCKILLPGKQLKHLLETSFFPHALGAEVGVAAGTIPVPRDGFGIEGHHDPKVLAHPVQDEARDPEVIPHLNPFAWSHLELPLQGGGVRGSVGWRQAPPTP